ncbi:MAG: L,D-transpeptidase scaffold domain-containing protein, partial [Hyphomicrobium sp.]
MVLAATVFVSFPVYADNTAHIVKAALTQAGSTRTQADGLPGDVKRFYEMRAFRLAWTADTAAMAMQALARAGAEGLNPADYPVDPLPARANGKGVVTWDMQLTGAFLHYAKDVRTGRLPPGKVYANIELTPPAFDAAAELDAALKNTAAFKAFVAALPPPRPEYAFLRTALAHYHMLADDGDGPKLRAGAALASLT